jgi:hypothetical protein
MINELSDHPYDSPIEDIFAWHCKKYIRNDIEFDSQLDITTKHGIFRIDFVLSTKYQKIAVECDGKDFHIGYRDDIRDAIILGEEHVDIIYHFRGRELFNCPNECIWLMSVIEPEIFSRRGIMLLEHLNRLKIDFHKDLNSTMFLNGVVCIEDDKYHFRAIRNTIHTNPKLHPFWKVLYKFACDNPGLTLDELYEKDIRELRSIGGK